MAHAVWHSSFALLVITGALLGMSLPLGKLATGIGVSPILWSIIISLGAGSTLLVGLLLRGKFPGLSLRHLRYYFIVALVSYTIPNLLAFSLIGRLGAGYVGIMYTISPILTLALSWLSGVARPGVLGIAGIFTGFIGAFLVAMSRMGVTVDADLMLLAAGLLIPFFLSIGNVYRTLDWPENAGPIELAAGSHLASAFILVLVFLTRNEISEIELLADIPFLTLGQILSAALMFAFFFRLQTVGGPIYLSQIGYVAAVIGLASGMLLLGETYYLGTWLACLLIIAGVAMTTFAQIREAKARQLAARHGSCN